MDDDTLSRLRHRVIYEGYHNSLVEWTLSDNWAIVPRLLGVRGDLTRRGTKTFCDTDIANGTIECTH